MSSSAQGNPGHGGSGVFFAECQTGFMMECLRATLERGGSKIEARPEAVEAYVDGVASELENSVRSQSSFCNGYRGACNRVIAITAKRLVDFWNEYKTPNLDDYVGSEERS